jgi:nucleoid-associated protein YgaU
MAAINDLPMYRSLLKKRGISFIRQYKTPETHFPTDREIGSINEVDHTWKAGDRFFKLAHNFYNDSTLWWIIAWYNQTPTESHVSTGQVIQIPLPLDAVLPMFMRGS